MAVNVAACITAFLLSFITLPVIIKYFLRKNLVDIPGRRKIHKKVTPSMGGIGIFIGFVSATIIWMDLNEWTNMRYVIASLSIIFLLGVRDDLVPFRAFQKLVGQIVAIIVLSFSTVQITSFYGFLGVTEIPVWLGYFITGFTLLVITNSFNLIDGLDGLAGSVGLVVLTSLGFWFYLSNDAVFALLSFSMIGGILAFLVFNWQPAEIFMGDTGAMVIGILLGMLVIHFMNSNYSLPSYHELKLSGTIASAAALLIIPLTDTLRIMILRISRGQSPFSPDKSHIHHALMRLGFSHGKTAITLASVNLVFIAMAFSLRHLGDIIMLPMVIFLAFVLSFILDRLITRKLSKG
jgi:UDP-GlcNAc:undecaprenyl-phosphate/decaprenyl-phosphate GlcNAc-1-phosphate transferase